MATTPAVLMLAAIALERIETGVQHACTAAAATAAFLDQMEAAAG